MKCSVQCHALNEAGSFACGGYFNDYWLVWILGEKGSQEILCPIGYVIYQLAFSCASSTMNLSKGGLGLTTSEELKLFCRLLQYSTILLKTNLCSGASWTADSYSMSKFEISILMYFLLSSLLPSIETSINSPGSRTTERRSCSTQFHFHLG